MIRVLLVDDHQLLREMLSWRLRGDAEVTVVGEAGSAAEAHRQAEALSPDVVVLDVTLPGQSGLQGAAELLRLNHKVEILFLSMHTDLDTVAQAFSTGARGYVVKDQPFAAVRAAILAVAKGHEVLPPGITRAELDERMRQRAADAAAPSPLRALTTREKEVFDLLAHGISNNAIADRLRISVNTVETHRAHILKKLGVHSLSDIVRVAARHGLLQHS